MPTFVPKAVQEAKDKISQITKEIGAKPDPFIEAGTTTAIQATKQQQKPSEGVTTTPIVIGNSIANAEPVKVEQMLSVQHGQDFEQKYNVLQAKYNNEIPILHNRVRQLEEQLNSSNEIVQQLNSTIAQLKETKPAEPAKTNPKISALNPDDFEGYGKEMVDVIDSLNAVIAENDSLRGELSQYRTETTEKVSTVSRKMDENIFYNDIERAIPNVWEINNETWWRTWLAKPHTEAINANDVDLGKIRQVVLDEATKKMDSKKVVALFKQAIQQNGGQAASQAADKGRALSQQVVPDGGSASSLHIIAPGSFEPVSEEQLKKAERDKIQGKITLEQFHEILSRYTKTQRASSEGSFY